MTVPRYVHLSYRKLRNKVGYAQIPNHRYMYVYYDTHYNTESYGYASTDSVFLCCLLYAQHMQLYRKGYVILLCTDMTVYTNVSRGTIRINPCRLSQAVISRTLCKVLLCSTPPCRM